jgi:LmbE family N-acetylglucosaminyl deacetylase
VTYRLAAVFAHPDDDTHGVGGILAMEADNVDYTLVVVSSGEAGEIADPSLGTPETLGKVREEEELESLAVLGVRDPHVHFLRFPDGAVAEAPREELVDRIAEILSAARPHVVVSFGPEGVTKHADHIATGQAATEAFHRLQAEARDRAFQRLLYVAIPQSELDRYWNILEERGVKVDPDGAFMPRGVPDHAITVKVDCRSVVDRKLKALAAHRTQAFEDESFPEELQREAFGYEWFVQAWPPVTEPQGPALSSIFEGIEP